MILDPYTGEVVDPARRGRRVHCYGASATRGLIAAGSATPPPVPPPHVSIRADDSGASIISGSPDQFQSIPDRGAVSATVAAATTPRRPDVGSWSGRRVMVGATGKALVSSRAAADFAFLHDATEALITVRGRRLSTGGGVVFSTRAGGGTLIGLTLQYSAGGACSCLLNDGIAQVTIAGPTIGASANYTIQIHKTSEFFRWYLDGTLTDEWTRTDTLVSTDPSQALCILSTRTSDAAVPLVGDLAGIVMDRGAGSGSLRAHRLYELVTDYP